MKRAQREVPPKKDFLPSPNSPKVTRTTKTVIRTTQSDWLTPVQLEIVRLLSQGLFLKEIAYLKGRSEGTFKVYLCDARKRTGCTNTYHLVAEYVRRVECPAHFATTTTNS